MLKKIASTATWLPSYQLREAKRRLKPVKPKHIHFCICDHFEPYWNGASAKTARGRLQSWLDTYPRIAERHRDADGKILKYSFFYPEEEYREEDLKALAELCHAGYGEVEIHLHHDNDTSENLRRTLLDFKKRLHEKHGLLSIDEETKEIVYGFIHGNWALDNSRPDGRWCGVNDEITILQQTGCYADFTMPSAPSDTQTRKTNSIYYAIDDPMRPKSHDWGRDAEVGRKGEGLLMIQGPLVLNWHTRKFGCLPRIENGGLYPTQRIDSRRVRCWIDAGVHVKGAPEHVFVKLYTHGCNDGVLQTWLLGGGFDALLGEVRRVTEEDGLQLHWGSARDMARVVSRLEKAAVSGEADA